MWEDFQVRFAMVFHNFSFLMGSQETIGIVAVQENAYMWGL